MSETDLGQVMPEDGYLLFALMHVFSCVFEPTCIFFLEILHTSHQWYRHKDRFADPLDSSLGIPSLWNEAHIAHTFGGQRMALSSCAPRAGECDLTKPQDGYGGE